MTSPGLADGNIFQKIYKLVYYNVTFQKKQFLIKIENIFLGGLLRHLETNAIFQPPALKELKVKLMPRY